LLISSIYGINYPMIPFLFNKHKFICADG